MPRVAPACWGTAVAAGGVLGCWAGASAPVPRAIATATAAVSLEVVMIVLVFARRRHPTIVVYPGPPELRLNGSFSIGAGRRGARGADTNEAAFDPGHGAAAGAPATQPTAPPPQPPASVLHGSVALLKALAGRADSPFAKG